MEMGWQQKGQSRRVDFKILPPLAFKTKEEAMSQETASAMQELESTCSWILSQNFKGEH